ncbi:MAG: hypothetical protein U5N53_34275 [Mycobacterium sp.]|nr:hypothetical protein [Mycobacterium sp.]
MIADTWGVVRRAEGCLLLAVAVLNRHTGPPASRGISVPVWKLRNASRLCR